MRKVAISFSAWVNTGMWPLKYVTWPCFFANANSLVMWVTPAGNIGRLSLGMDRFSRLGEQNDPTIPAPRHHLKILPIRPVALALPVLFLWIALTYRTIPPVVPASQPRLRSGG